MKVWILHILPPTPHEVRFLRADDVTMQVETSEQGGPVLVWKYQLKVDAVHSLLRRYTDRIEIHAGWLTPVVWLFASVFYRYRQMQWRKLAHFAAI